jgi:hypothetical protein
MISTGCYDASAGFFGATEELVATPSLEVNAQRKQNSHSRGSRLQSLRSEDGFWIGPGNFAHGNPAEAADKRAN